jgi:hypothetical protein
MDDGLALFQRLGVEQLAALREDISGERRRLRPLVVRPLSRPASLLWYLTGPLVNPRRSERQSRRLWALDDDGNIVGKGDMRVQIEQAGKNVDVSLWLC